MKANGHTSRVDSSHNRATSVARGSSTAWVDRCGRGERPRERRKYDNVVATNMPSVKISSRRLECECGHVVKEGGGGAPNVATSLVVQSIPMRAWKDCQARHSTQGVIPLQRAQDQHTRTGTHGH
jgi:hypothetical protein